MNEFLKGLIESGFEVFYITIGQAKPEKTPKQEFVERIQKTAREDKQKRINWKTINKIKALREDGMSSKEVADELKISLYLVNKYWEKPDALPE